MTDYSPEKEGYDKKNLSEKQKKFKENLQACPDGNAIKAATEAGYSNPYQAVRQNADLIKQLVDDEMVRLSIKSVKTLEKVQDSSAGIPQAGEKLKSAVIVLERTHPKTDHVDVTGEIKGGIFVLPNKKPLDNTNEQD